MKLRRTRQASGDKFPDSAEVEGQGVKPKREGGTGVWYECGHPCITQTTEPLYLPPPPPPPTLQLLHLSVEPQQRKSLI